MWSHSVTCHPTQVNAPRLYPSQASRYSIYLPRRDGRLSWLGVSYMPRWFTCSQTVTHPSSNHLVVTLPGVEPTTSRSWVQRPNRYATKPPKFRSFWCADSQWVGPASVLRRTEATRILMSSISDTQPFIGSYYDASYQKTEIYSCLLRRSSSASFYRAMHAVCSAALLPQVCLSVRLSSV